MILVQRYPEYLWPILRGRLPLIVTGPSFCDVSDDGAGARPFWRMTSEFCAELRSAVSAVLGGAAREHAQRDVAELMLACGFVQALWVTHTPDPNDLPPPEERWGISVEAIAREIPVGYHGPDDLSGDLLELLDGMSSPEYYRTLLGAHDELTLEQQTVVI